VRLRGLRLKSNLINDCTVPSTYRTIRVLHLLNKSDSIEFNVQNRYRTDDHWFQSQSHSQAQDILKLTSVHCR